ncbi:MAG: phenylacetate-CoA oxygenase subunit PaaJ [Acidobacteria bacterium]|nr:MAG: phenylacetate-CoA oxygenase subunit PaaJ [Acidobacteriota bacterium]
MSEITENEVWEALGSITDPEIPVISIVELGVVRTVRVDAERTVVEITPTFSACPAYQAMAGSVERKLREMGATGVEVRTVLHPPWSTDWLSDEAREKLRRFGLAVPDRHQGNLEGAIEAGQAACPYCGSSNTRQTNPFGCTPCRAMGFCQDCRQPFEQLKPL